MDGDAVRWLGVALFALGGAIRLWPVFVLGDRFSGLVAIQPGRPRISPRTRDPKSALPLRPSADRLGNGFRTPIMCTGELLKLCSCGVSVASSRHRPFTWTGRW